ncbi:CDP-alcohol phosphatidyltransferase [Hymenobacter psoromatis]|nr:CDP-alcohol phosphatidyltransferase [Hymenobacter psoromatis]
MTFDALRTALQGGIYQVINPFVRLLIRLGFTPNAVTLTGFGLNVGVAVLFIVGGEEGNRGDLRYVGWGGALILFAGLFDMLDGQVARLGNMQSTYGALFDSVLDRYSELFTFLGICYYLVAHHYLLGSLGAFIALIGSMMVSYTRARAEGLGVECKGGLMQRPERVVLLGVSALACGVSSAWLGGDYKLFVPGIPFHVFETMSILTFPIAVLAVLANITAVARLRQAKRALALRAAAPAAALPPSQAAKAAVLLIGLLGSSLSLVAAGQQPTPMLTYPVPSGVAHQLFYLQRDPNTNTIIYQLNVNSAGQLDEDEPINIFWLRYEEQGQRKDLNFIQRRFAYGLSARKIAPGKYALKFAAYGKVPFVLMKSGFDNAFHVYATVANKQIQLERVYLRIEGGTFWVPNVRYIELTGRDAASQKPVVERIPV